MIKKIFAIGVILLLAMAIGVMAQEADSAKMQEKMKTEMQKPAEKAAEKQAEMPTEKKAEMPAEKMKTEAKSMGGLTVEAEICSGIEERMPSGMADTFAPDVDTLYLWTRVLGCKDTTMIHHKWYREGEEMADVELPVKSSSWRTWSSKAMMPSWTGNWEVKVTDADGNVLATVPFTVQ